jgi:hypothetical protein
MLNIDTRTADKKNDLFHFLSSNRISSSSPPLEILNRNIKDRNTTDWLTERDSQTERQRHAESYKLKKHILNPTDNKGSQVYEKGHM